ncbi:MAG: hypothetical protein FJX20_19075 [Alphaproteobacteria bacterium]|nr:hypothetical protein [Alphaproteobacteria bacterium]
MGISRGLALWPALVSLGAVVWLSSCATVTSGTTQTIGIVSEPGGATCEMRRDGALLASVHLTPEVIRIPRSKNTIELTCKRDGYEPTTEMVESKFSGATIGNVLAGGLIGIAVDAASGANNFYPDQVTVLMQPSVFADEVAREAFFGRLRERVQKRAQDDLTMLRYQCASKPREFCDADTARLTAKRDKDLADIEARRLAARVAPTANRR